MDPKFYIRLDNAVYECRVRDGVREVLAFGGWMRHDDFVNRLADDGCWGQVADLCKAACILKPDEVSELINRHLVSTNDNN